MSRQRIRASVLESTTQVCSHCGGTGHVRSQSSVALHVLRGVEEYLLKNTTHNITVRTTPDIALYLLNHKRQTIVDYESRFGVAIIIDADGSVGAQHFAIDRGEPVENPVKIESLFNFEAIPDDDDDDIVIEHDEEEDEELEEKPVAAERPAARAEAEGEGGRKRKRRRRRRGRNGNAEQQVGADTVSDVADDSDEGEDDGSEGDSDASEAPAETHADGEDSQRRKRRRRGKRGGRRNRGEEGAEVNAASEGDEGDDSGADETSETAAEVIEVVAAETVEAQPAMAAVEAGESVAEEVKPARGRGRRKAAAAPSPIEEPVIEAPIAETAAQADSEVMEASADLATPAQEEAKPVRANRGSNISSSEPTVTSTRTESAEAEGEGKPKKAGWWQRRGFF
jgi:ribonuclease E